MNKQSRRTAQQSYEWMRRGACVGEDPTLFYPENRDQMVRLEQEQRAKQICGSCAVRSVCLDYAVTFKQQYGIWGGLNEHERRWPPPEESAT